MDLPVQDKVKVRIKGCQGCKWHEAIKYDWMEYTINYCHEPRGFAQQKTHLLIERDWINGASFYLGLPHPFFTAELPTCQSMRCDPTLCGASARYYKPRHKIDPPNA
jgi:hypothetical protein